MSLPRMNQQSLQAMFDAEETRHVLAKALHLRIKMRYERARKRHRDQIRLRVWMGRIGFTLDDLLDCYWNEIHGWMADRRVVFKLAGGRHVAQLLQNIFDQRHAEFEVRMTGAQLQLEVICDLLRRPIQHKLLDRGSTKTYIRKSE